MKVLKVYSNSVVDKFKSAIYEHNLQPKLSDFDKFRFDGLVVRDMSNNYFEMTRVSDDGQKIVVSVANSHIFGTKYGYGLRLDDTHVLWLKDWQVGENRNGNLEIILTKKYFNPKEWGNPDIDFDANPDALTWEHWLSVANEQQNAGNFAIWRKKKSISRQEYEIDKQIDYEYK